MALTFSGTQKVELASFTWPSPAYSVSWWANGVAGATDMLYWIQANCLQSYFVSANLMIDLQNADASGVFRTGITPADQWNHFCFTHDTTSTATLPKFYLNGVEQTVTLNNGGGTQFTPAASALTFGNDPAGSGSTGKPLAWFNVWNRVLSGAEVTTLQTTGTILSGLQVGWDCEAQTNQTDLSGNGRTGVLTGTPTVTAGPIAAPSGDPAFQNPSATPTGTAGWFDNTGSTLARNTSVFESTPASMLAGGSDSMVASFTAATFRADTTYTITGFIRTGGFAGADMGIVFGKITGSHNGGAAVPVGDIATVAFDKNQAINTWLPFTITWSPSTDYVSTPLTSHADATAANKVCLWFGQTGSAKYIDSLEITSVLNALPPTITAGALLDVYSGSSITPVLPTHAANDILLAQGAHNAGSTLSCATSGWAAIGSPQNDANFSTGWFWKRATSGAEANPVISSSVAASSTAGLFGQAFVISGAETSGTPYEDATLNGTPTSSTTPASATITTTTDAELALVFAAIHSSGAFASGLPPSGWTTVSNLSDLNLIVPTITVGALAVVTDAAAPYQCTPTLPAHVTGDILVAFCGAGSSNNWTCPTSGWAEIVAAQNHATFSTGWFWKRAASGAEANPVCTASASLTLGGYAVAFKVSGCIATGTPFEDATLLGVQTTADPASALITTLGLQRLAVAIAQIEDNNAISVYPPATWTGNFDGGSNTGDDYHANVISKTVAVAGDVAAVNICHQNASDAWKTLTLAFIPATAVAEGRFTVLKKTAKFPGDVAGVTVGTLSAAAYWKTLALAFKIPVPIPTRLKRWNGSTWVPVVMKTGTSWAIVPPVETL